MMMEDCYGSHVFEKLITLLAVQQHRTEQQRQPHAEGNNEQFAFENLFLQLCEVQLDFRSTPLCSTVVVVAAAIVTTTKTTKTLYL